MDRVLRVLDSIGFYLGFVAMNILKTFGESSARFELFDWSVNSKDF
jgi:hypothetical protein